jgi:hypothetical protein
MTTQIFAIGRGALLHSRCQQAVGQGGFHTAKLVSTKHPAIAVRSPTETRVEGTNSFHYVYDCGSRQLGKCRSVAHRFASSIADRRIDLLFLSHFDEDHVNGLPDLLNPVGGVKADTVVMPWVDDVERLIAFGRTALRGRAIGDFFRSLIVDPLAALDVFRPRRILLVRRGPGDPDDRDVIDLRPDGLDPEGPFGAKVVIDGGSWRRGPASPNPNPGVTADVHVIYDDATIEVSADAASWVFKPYVRPCDQGRVSNFEREAERLLGWPWGSFRPAVADAAVRNRLVGNKASIKALATAYRLAFGDRNLTSLCVYSGPQPAHHGRVLSFDLTKFGLAGKIGWLATGDVPLKDPAEARELLSHYQAQVDCVATFGLPHHGSVKNYSSMVVAALRPQTCFVSAKPPKNWQHPHPAVMADVANQGAAGIHVDDTEASAFSEAFLVL